MGKQLSQNDTKRIDISPGVNHNALFQHFRCQITIRAGRLFEINIIATVTKAKINDFHHIIVVDQNIVGLKVPMHNSKTMEIVHSIKDLQRHITSFAKPRL